MKMAMADDQDDDALDDIVVDAATDAPRAAGAGIAERIGSRNLLIIIVTMPFVFFVVVMAIIAIFGAPEDKAAPTAAYRGEIGRDGASDVYAPADALTEPAMRATARVIEPTPASGAVAPGAVSGVQYGAIALDGDRLAVRVDGERGPEVRIYDLTTNDLTQVVPLGADGAAPPPGPSPRSADRSGSVVIAIDPAAIDNARTEPSAARSPANLQIATTGAADDVETASAPDAAPSPITFAAPAPSLKPSRTDAAEAGAEAAGDDDAPFNPYEAVLPGDAGAAVAPDDQ